MRNDCCIDQVGLCTFAQCLSEGPYLRRVDDGDIETGTGKSISDYGFVASCCFERDEHLLVYREMLDQFRETLAVARDSQGLALRADMYIETILRNIDPYKNLFHDVHPC